MKIIVYPADSHGCGFHRLIWVSEILQEQGHDVHLIDLKDPTMKLMVRGEVVEDVILDPSVDVVVLQRVTHSYMSQAVPIIRAKGAAVVVDVDDDLTAIPPGNPAFEKLHPKNLGRMNDKGRPHRHSWNYLTYSCKHATLVTVSTPALQSRYANHGRSLVLPNYLPDHHYQTPHVDSDLVGWPASLHSHPDDPSVVGNAVSRIVQDGAKFVTLGHPAGSGRAFGLTQDPPGSDPIEILNWPNRIAELGIAITPLADTKFNSAKSWLKPLECAAVGVPWIGSPRTEYKKLADLGCGVMVEKPKEWYRAIKSLRQDPIRRQELSEAGRIVADRMRLRDKSWLWIDAWEHAHKLQRSLDKELVK